MTWEYWMQLYLGTHCTARGLASKTIDAYRLTLEGFRRYVKERLGDKGPREIAARDVLEYLEYLRKERRNGGSAVNRQVTVLKNFYRAMVAMEQMEPRENPLANFPKIKPGMRKLPVTITRDEARDLFRHPRTDTVLGLRDRAMLVLLYGTGIRASECADLREGDVDLVARTIKVMGKGARERTVPLNEDVVAALSVYRQARGPVSRTASFFRSRRGGPMSRYGIYERVRSHARKARIPKPVSPHRLRHSFATELVREGVNLVVIRDLLGHRQITSTQLYLHLTAQDMRVAAEKHPVRGLVERIADLLPNVRLPMQCPAG